MLQYVIYRHLLTKEQNFMAKRRQAFYEHGIGMCKIIPEDVRYGPCQYRYNDNEPLLPEGLQPVYFFIAGKVFFQEHGQVIDEAITGSKMKEKSQEKAHRQVEKKDTTPGMAVIALYTHAHEILEIGHYTADHQAR